MPEFTGTLKPPRLASAPSSPTPGQMYFDTVSNTLLWWDGTAWKSGGGSGGSSGLVSALPTSPQDGDECYYQNATMATQGAIWHLRYRANSPNAEKWEMLGGGDLLDQVTLVSITSTAMAAYSPVQTPPLAGVYDVEYGGRVYSSTGTGGVAVNFAVLQRRAGATVATLSNMDLWTGPLSTGGGAYSQVSTYSKSFRTPSLPLGDSLSAGYAVNSGVATADSGVYMRLRPLRVS